MEDKFLIRVDIGDGTYGLRIRREEEQLFREAAKQLRIKLEQYRQSYAGSDTKDLLAMAALQLSVENLRLLDKNDTAPFTGKIEELTAEMTACLERDHP